LLVFYLLNSEGTHDWNKFIPPKDLQALLKRHAVNCQDVTGLVYNPFSLIRGEPWVLDPSDIDANYLLCATKQSEE